MSRLEDDLRTDTVSLAKKYSFFLPDKAANFDMDAHTTATPLKGDFQGFNRTHLQDDRMIARVTLALGMSSRGQSLMITPTIRGATGVPVYYLPWDDRGAAVRMEIPDRDPALPEDQHPNVFFTAILSGCSIIFKGTSQNPTIYHCGTAGGEVGTATPRDTTKFANSDAFFRQMLSGRGYRAIGGQINKTDYMVPALGGGGDAVADVEQQFLAAIKQQPQFQRGFILKTVVSWGVCFGFRKGHDWKFYLQENGTIVYDTFRYDQVRRETDVTKKTLFGAKTVTKSYVTAEKKIVTAGNRISRPMVVKRVFPGTGTAKMTPSWNLLEL
jgi:hypothetical protein